MKLKNLWLSITSALLMVFSFPNIVEPGLGIHTAFLIWVAYIPLFIAIFSEEKTINVFMYSTITGLFFYLGGLYWLCAIKPMGIFAYVAWFALSSYLTILFAAAAGIARLISKKYKISLFFSFPVVFVIFDYIREWLFSGCSFLTPAQSQFQNIFLIQTASVTGLYGIVFLIVVVNAFLALLWMKKTEEIKSPQGALVFAIAAVILVFSAMGYMAPEKQGRIKIKTAILQPDINQDVEWNSAYKKKVLEVFKELSDKIKNEKIDLVVWPESGFPGFLQHEKSDTKAIAAWTGNRAYTLVGGDYYERASDKNYLYYNSVFVVDPKGKLINRYDKRHLVPFGEYVPFEHVFTFIRKVVRRYGFNGFEFGKKVEPLNLGQYKAGALICYDSLFPEISRETVKKGAGILAHLSYETWYGKGPASAQVFTNTILRAVENHVYIVRSVASGISGIVTDRGKIVGTTGLFKRETLVAEVYINDTKTFYTKYGDVFVYLLFLLMAVFIGIKVVKK
ncbi:MAG: apolipoprotein N-acyltransferase [bacterium]